MRRLGIVLFLVLGLAVTATAAAHPEPNDVDGDGVLNERDNCMQTRNADQLDRDGDGAGDRCDTDADGDGVANSVPYLDRGDDNCPLVPNPGQEPASQNPRFGAACYVDTDNDAVPDPLDNCPAVPNPGQLDYDYDRTGDACDPDDDEDGEFDVVDNCPLTYNYDQADADGDGIGDACDSNATDTGGPSGGGGTAERDSRAPGVRMAVATVQRMAELGRSLAVKVRCSEGCAVSARLTVDSRTARRLRIGRRATVVARGTAALAGRGTTYVFMRFKRGVTRRLGSVRSVRAALTLTAEDGAGNRRSATRSLRLGR
jgi:thrombospondin type 3 repeat protein